MTDDVHPDASRRNKPFKAVALKAAALALGVATWYGIHNSINFESEVQNVDITALLSEGWTVLERSTETVDVRFRGSQDDIRFLKPENVQIIVDLRGREKRGTVRVDLQTENVRGPGGARPIHLRPDSIQLTLDREDEKLVPVKFRTIGEPAAGVDVDTITCKPAAVRITGPEQRLQEIERVLTVPINLTDRRRSFETRLAISEEGLERISRIQPSRVSADVTLVERSSERTIDAVAVAVLTRPGPALPAALDPREVDVTIRGHDSDLEEVRLSDVIVYVDATALEGVGEYELPLRVNVPDPVDVVNIDPARATLTLETP